MTNPNEQPADQPFNLDALGLGDIKIPEAFKKADGPVVKSGMDLKGQAAPKSAPKSEAKSEPTEWKDEMLATPPDLIEKSAFALAGESEFIRNLVTQRLKKFWPAAYARYQAIKYPVPGSNPTLETRKAAYEFAWKAFLALSYRKSNA